MVNKLENFSCICGSQTVCQSQIDVDGLKLDFGDPMNWIELEDED
mgnify:CR=1 FL=1